MKDVLVIYHADCPDGFGSAYAAWRVLGDRADYLPRHHGDQAPDVTGRDVYILDFAFDADTMNGMRGAARSVTLLDHHRTAHDQLACLACGPGFRLLFDMQRSGARMAWEHFHPGVPLPYFMACIEDRDLWRWQYDDTRPLLAALDVLPFDFGAWEAFHREADDPAQRAGLVARGQAVVQRFEHQVQDIASHAFQINFLGHSVWAVNASSEFTSDVGNVLAQRSGTFGIVFRVDSSAVVKVALRAVSGFDASGLAMQFGGGGHPQACAFRLPIGQLPAFLAGTLSPAATAQQP